MSLKLIFRSVPDLLRPGDKVAVLGDDKIGVLMEGYRLGDAIRIANQMQKELMKLRFEWRGKHFKTTAGISLSPITQAQPIWIG